MLSCCAAGTLRRRAEIRRIPSSAQELGQRAAKTFERELAGPESTVLGHRAIAFRMSGHVNDRVGNLCGRARTQKDTSTLQHGRQLAVIDGDAERTERHRFGHSLRPSFGVARRKHKTLRPFVPPQRLVEGQRTGECGHAGQTQLGDATLERGALGPFPNQGQLQRDTLIHGQPNRLDQRGRPSWVQQIT